MSGDRVMRIREMVANGLHDHALVLYQRHVHPQLLQTHNHRTPHQQQQQLSFLLPSLIKASSSHHHLLRLQLHCLALKIRSCGPPDPAVSNSLVTAYAKSSDPDSARKVFHEMPLRDVVSWNSLVNCYARNGRSQEALRAFKEMRRSGFVPNPELIATVLSHCCRHTGGSRLGRAIHGAVIVDERVKDSVLLWTALVDMYFKALDSKMAFRVFHRMEEHNEVSWTAMVSGCMATGDYGMGLHLFRAMQREGIEPNRVTLIAVLPVCIELGCSKLVKEIHGYSFRHGFTWEFRFLSALMHAYSQFGEGLRPAKRIFEMSPSRDAVMWSSLIRSCSQNGDGSEAIMLYHRMRMEGIEPNSVTLLAVISACTKSCSLSLGHSVHAHALKCGLRSAIFVGNSLISMYSKCGSLADSFQVFKEIQMRDAASWSAIIGAHGLHGCGEEALHFFHEMKECGIEPDAVTLLSALSACNHAGLVKEGQKLFCDAVEENSIPLCVEHYACYLDTLGRSGMLEDALSVLSTMPMKPSAKIWSSLASACKIHGRLEVMEKLVDCLIRSDPDNAANYTALSVMFAESGNWVAVDKIRRLMKMRGLKKSCGFSQVDMSNGL